MDWLGVAVPRRGGGKAFEKPEAGRVTLAVAVEVPAVLAERVSQLRLARGQIGGTSAAAFPAFRRGYDRDAALTPIRQGDGGLMAPIELQELDRLEIHLSPGPFGPLSNEWGRNCARCRSDRRLIARAGFSTGDWVRDFWATLRWSSARWVAPRRPLPCESLRALGLRASGDGDDAGCLVWAAPV